ncbi:MAG: arsenite methyltransferase [Dehalococcoidia bacterium]|nr:arsenite methyltransferase [Dehalococcoidia bacterium]
MTAKPPVRKQDQQSTEIKKAVRLRYASAATSTSSGCCGRSTGCGPAKARPDLVEISHYSPEELAGLPEDAVEHALGCGNPLAFSGVKEGEVVLDIGSGAGIDALLASKIVGPKGRVIGLDFTPEMIAKAQENVARAGVSNVEFRFGDADNMPLEDSSVDWVISNCVINLAPDKRRVFSEVFRVLKPGGSVSISDIVTAGLSEEVKSQIGLWTSCIAGAIEEEAYLGIMREAGLVDVSVAARQRYDQASVLELLEEMVQSQADRRLAKGLLGQGKEAVSKIWSAKIVGRKPA